MSLFGIRHHPPSGLPTEGDLAEFDGATGWLNTPPLTRAGLMGKVVLVDFWTYTCINWLRTLGYVRAWHEKYHDHGLVVVGVHTPEFPFEQDPDNVRRAVQQMDIGYPVALDPDYDVWRAFNNRYWPAIYIADADGHIRYHHFGEGMYEECERVVQQLLRAAGRDVDGDLVDITPTGFEAQADWSNLQSPETYVGYEQGGNFASPGGAAYDEPHAYETPDSLSLNTWALSGNWTIGGRACMLNDAGGRITFRYHARDVNLVLAPAVEGASVDFRVGVDGEPPGAAHGLDVDEQGRGTVTEPRLYQLVREPGRFADRTFHITFDAPGVEAYVFTFG
jgi:thiol-disulfide isomerase/thioredoxin